MDPLKTPEEHNEDAEKIKEYFAFHTILIDKIPYRNAYFVVTHTVYDNRDIYRSWIAWVENGQVMLNAQNDPIILMRPEF